jgi:hypothetical protein
LIRSVGKNNSSIEELRYLEGDKVLGPDAVAVFSSRENAAVVIAGDDKDCHLDNGHFITLDFGPEGAVRPTAVRLEIEKQGGAGDRGLPRAGFAG